MATLGCRVRAPGHRHTKKRQRRHPVTPPQASIAPRHWPAPAAEHRDRATTPEASSPRPRDRGRDRTVRQLDPRADGQPGWLDSERRQRPPSYRGTPTTLPPLPANRRTPPAVVATEGVALGRRTQRSAQSRPGIRSVHGGRARFHRRLTSQTGGQRLPRLPLTPPRVATRARLPGGLAGQVAPAACTAGAGGSRPGGAQGWEPPTLVVDRSPDRALASPQLLHRVGPRLTLGEALLGLKQPEPGRPDGAPQPSHGQIAQAARIVMAAHPRPGRRAAAHRRGVR
jgi:hypothetical protein